MQVTSITILMTWLFLRTRGSVLLAVLAHLTFNTAEAVVYSGLPDLAVTQERSVYLVSVVLLAVLAAAVSGHLATSRQGHRAA